jgi:hypothetical protein
MDAQGLLFAKAKTPENVVAGEHCAGLHLRYESCHRGSKIPLTRQRPLEIRDLGQTLRLQYRREALLRASINRRRRTGTFNISDLPELDRGDLMCLGPRTHAKNRV